MKFTVKVELEEGICKKQTRSLSSEFVLSLLQRGKQDLFKKLVGEAEIGAAGCMRQLLGYLDHNSTVLEYDDVGEDGQIVRRVHLVKDLDDIPKEAMELAKMHLLQQFATINLDVKNWSEGDKLKIKNTDTLVAKYAKLPVIAPSQDYLVSYLEPIETVPRKIVIDYYMSRQLQPKGGYEIKDGKVTDESRLGIYILEEWKALLAYQGDLGGCEWMKNINKVRLIECDILVPKDICDAII